MLDAQEKRQKNWMTLKENIITFHPNKKTSSKTQNHQSISKRLLELFIMEEGILCKRVLEKDCVRSRD